MRAGRFPRTGRLRRGYHPGQVEQFFADIQVALSGGLPPPTAGDVRQAGFELVRRGYDTAAVDVALDALEERVLVSRGTAAGRRGRPDPASEVAFLVGQLASPYMQRFPRAGPLGQGYHIDDVDELVDRVIAALDATGPPVGIEDVRSAVFRPRRGGYREDAVDERLDRVVELLLVQRGQGGART